MLSKNLEAALQVATVAADVVDTPPTVAADTKDVGAAIALLAAKDAAAELPLEAVPQLAVVIPLLVQGKREATPLNLTRKRD